MIFKIKNGKLIESEEKQFKLEKDLQTLVETNLMEILGLKFLKTEFPIESYRFDTVAFNEENNAFIIIEYKRGRNESLVDQGYAYLHTLLNRKADFVLLYNEVTKSSKSINDFSWNQTRMIFISPNFTNYQKNATSFINMPFELYEVKQYQDGIVVVNEINKIKESKIDDTPEIPSTDKVVSEVEKEIIVYTEKMHLKKTSSEMRDIYFDLKYRILELGEIKIEPKKTYIAFKSKTNIFDVIFLNKIIKIYINMKKGTLKDPENISEDVSKKGHFGNGDYQITIKNSDDLDALIGLIKQSYKVNR